METTNLLSKQYDRVIVLSINLFRRVAATGLEIFDTQ